MEQLRHKLRHCDDHTAFIAWSSPCSSQSLAAVVTDGAADTADAADSVDADAFADDDVDAASGKSKRQQ